MKVLFIVPYPVGRAPSQRFRIEQFFPILEKAKIEYDIIPFMGDKTWDVLYGKKAIIKKVIGITGGYLRRLKLILFNTGKYDVFVIHREASPLGPPVFEWVLAKLLRKKYIYDFDDAIWEPKISEANRLAVYIRSFWKTKYLCRWAFINTAGNRFLADYATRAGAKNVLILPTVVDTENRYVVPVPGQEKEILTIGWTGSHSTLPYLESLTAVLKKLRETHKFKLYVIADKPPGKDLEYEFIKWNAQDEIKQLHLFDIGIMPIYREPFSEGKCGFKLIQYMAMGIPGIADHTGANAAIVDNGVNGYICNSEEEWLAALKELLENNEKRKRMGQLARQKIVASYSLQSQENLLLDCLTQCQLANKK